MTRDVNDYLQHRHRPRASSSQPGGTRLDAYGAHMISARSALSTQRSTDLSARYATYPNPEQIMNESASFAKCKSANTYSESVFSTGQGQQLMAEQQFKSRKRIPDYDFSVTRANNNYSNLNKLTRADPFYMRPKLAVTNNSVKYNILTNSQRPFKYS